MSLPGYKPKYKKAPWVLARQGKPEPAKCKRFLRPVSKRRQEVNRQYRSKVREYLKRYPKCRLSYEWALGCSPHATEVHHIRGRAGGLLMNDAYWLAVCREAHNWIHRHPKLAQANGWLALPGLWGSNDRDWQRPK